MVLGGYGNFGAIISARLARDPTCAVVVAGRDAKKAREHADRIGAAAACIVWALVPNHMLGTIAWVLIVGCTTVFGIIWDRGTPYT